MADCLNALAGPPLRKGKARKTWVFSFHLDIHPPHSYQTTWDPYPPRTPQTFAARQTACFGPPAVAQTLRRAASGALSEAPRRGFNLGSSEREGLFSASSIFWRWHHVAVRFDPEPQGTSALVASPQVSSPAAPLPVRTPF